MYQVAGGDDHKWEPITRRPLPAVRPPAPARAHELAFETLSWSDEKTLSETFKKVQKSLQKIDKL